MMRIFVALAVVAAAVLAVAYNGADRSEWHTCTQDADCVLLAAGRKNCSNAAVNEKAVSAYLEANKKDQSSNCSTSVAPERAACVKNMCTLIPAANTSGLPFGGI